MLANIKLPRGSEHEKIEVIAAGNITARYSMGGKS